MRVIAVLVAVVQVLQAPRMCLMLWVECEVCVLFHTLVQFGVDQKRLDVRVQELVRVDAVMSATGVSASEIYSPPRVIKLAEQYGLQPGVALDITVCDEMGEPWDFCDPRQRAKAKRLIQEQAPLLC